MTNGYPPNALQAIHIIWRKIEHAYVGTAFAKMHGVFSEKKSAQPLVGRALWGVFRLCRLD